MEGKEGNPNNEVSLDDDLETFRQTDKVTDSWVTLTALLKVGKPPNSLFLDTIEFLTMELGAIVLALINGEQLWENQR